MPELSLPVAARPRSAAIFRRGQASAVSGAENVGHAEGAASLRPYGRIRTFGALPARFLLGLIWVYQRTLSPALPVIFGPACGCRFAPTCSHYAAEALRTHGLFAGGFLAIRRLLKCTPLHPGGLDPVPARTRFSCAKVSPANPARR